jgi:hypothetical protein
MNTHLKPEAAVESRITSSFLEALIRAVTLYPLHQMIASRVK